MARKHRHRPRRRVKRRNLGAPPGSVIVDPAAPRSSIQVLAYGPDGYEESTDIPPAKLRELMSRYPVVWINVDGLGDAVVVEQLGEIFELHRLALEDVVHTHQRAKVDLYGDTLFIAARMIDAQQLDATEQLGLFLGRHFLLTFQERPGDCFEPIRRRIREGVGRVRQLGPDFLAYSLLDAVIDAYFPVVELCGEQLDEVEEAIIAGPGPHALSKLHAIKGELLMLRRAVWPHREMLAELARESTPMVHDATRVYLRDCYDHVIQITDLIETYRELSADLRDLYLSAVNNRINETMRVLTIIATIFIPITFIASIYGMNFDNEVSGWNMPELKWRWGYPGVLGMMILTTIAMWIYFRRRGLLAPAE
ncbi:MAG: magnesium/cobalt transporter CorA [Planctomycetota bacterium]